MSILGRSNIDFSTSDFTLLREGKRRKRGKRKKKKSAILSVLLIRSQRDWIKGGEGEKRYHRTNHNSISLQGRHYNP